MVGDGGGGGGGMTDCGVASINICESCGLRVQSQAALLFVFP